MISQTPGIVTFFNWIGLMTLCVCLMSLHWNRGGSLKLGDSLGGQKCSVWTSQRKQVNSKHLLCTQVIAGIGIAWGLAV